MAVQKKFALGRGLDALISNNEEEDWTHLYPTMRKCIHPVRQISAK